jgi:hypothetical protein
MTVTRPAESAPQADTVAARAPRLFGDRDTRLYLCGQITSMVGDSSLWLAMGIWVKTLTGSSSAAALCWLAFILGGLTGPLSAVLVDRLRVRPLLVSTNLIAAAVVLVLLGVHGTSDVWLVYPVMFGYGVAYALLNAGTSAVIKPMFGNARIAGANAVLATAKQGMNLIAPIIGAGLFAVVGATPVIIADAATFVVAAVALSLIRRPMSAGAAVVAGKPGAWVVLGAGMRHIMTTPALRRVVLAVSVAVLGLGFLEPAEFSVNSEGLGRAPAFTGFLFAFQGLGAIIGGVFAARAVRGLGEVRTAAVGLAATAAGTALMAVPVLPVVLLAFAVYGAALPWFIVAQQTQLQRLTEPHMQGRVAGASGLLTRTPQAVGIAVGSALIGLLGYLVLLGFIALITASVAGWLFRSLYRGRTLT